MSTLEDLEKSLIPMVKETLSELSDQRATQLILKTDLKKILIICTGNSCRSIMLEALINQYGNDYFKAYSAGSMPNGVVHPMSLMTIKKNGIKPDICLLYTSPSPRDRG